MTNRLNDGPFLYGGKSAERECLLMSRSRRWQCHKITRPITFELLTISQIEILESKKVLIVGLIALTENYGEDGLAYKVLVAF